MSATLTIQFDPGDNIANAFYEAVQVSKRIGICVQFEFNDTLCIVYPHSNYKDGEDLYHRVQKEKHKLVIL
jgi:hypothetical protein